MVSWIKAAGELGLALYRLDEAEQQLAKRARRKGASGGDRYILSMCKEGIQCVRHARMLMEVGDQLDPER